MSYRVDVLGELRGSSVDDLTTKILALEAAYQVQGQTLGLYKDDGTTPTAHVWDNETTLGGIRSLGVSYPVGDRGEYSTWRKYKVSLEFDLENAGEELLAWVQTFSYRGFGGEIWKFLPTLTGLWTPQTVNEASSIQAVQRGSAIGRTGYPTAPLPVWPEAWHREMGGFDPKDPDRIGDTYRNYELAWEYHFESMFPFV